MRGSVQCPTIAEAAEVKGTDRGAPPRRLKAQRLGLWAQVPCLSNVETAPGPHGRLLFTGPRQEPQSTRRSGATRTVKLPSVP